MPRLPVSVSVPLSSMSSVLSEPGSVTEPKITLLFAPVSIVKLFVSDNSTLVPRRFKSPAAPSMSIVTAPPSLTPPATFVSVTTFAKMLSSSVTTPLVETLIDASSVLLAPT